MQASVCHALSSPDDSKLPCQSPSPFLYWTWMASTNLSVCATRTAETDAFSGGRRRVGASSPFAVRAVQEEGAVAFSVCFVMAGSTALMPLTAYDP